MHIRPFRFETHVSVVFFALATAVTLWRGGSTVLSIKANHCTRHLNTVLRSVKLRCCCARPCIDVTPAMLARLCRSSSHARALLLHHSSCARTRMCTCMYSCLHIMHAKVFARMCTIKLTTLDYVAVHNAFFKTQSTSLTMHAYSERTTIYTREHQHTHTHTHTHQEKPSEISFLCLRHEQQFIREYDTRN
jgi:hypothetical protein